MAAAGILVVLYDRRMDLTQGESKARQSIGIDEHFVLLREAADRCHLGNTVHRGQRITKVPILDRAEL